MYRSACTQQGRNPFISEIIPEAEKIVDAGVISVLTGVNVGDFGRSTGETSNSYSAAL
ncbi:MAG: hypothetical protein R2758_09210 [Bacteroidales bacterium]